MKNEIDKEFNLSADFDELNIYPEYEPNSKCTCPVCSSGEYCEACEDFGCQFPKTL